MRRQNRKYEYGIIRPDGHRRTLKEKTGADVFQIITKQQYSPDYDDGIVERADVAGCEADVTQWLGKVGMSR